MSHEIALFRGGCVVAHTIVDDADYEHLSTIKWHVTKLGYAQYTHHRDGRPRMVYMHRELLGLVYGDRREGDHINGIKLDNRRENLRIVTHAQNTQNVGKQARAVSRFRGVTRSRKGRPWQAQATFNGQHIYLGRFTHEADAAACALEWRKQNFPFSVEKRSVRREP